MLNGIKIIAADDDIMSLKMLETGLGSRGVHCTTVTNGREAMEALESNPDTDILLLDLQMPIMDGFEVLLQCKGNPYLSEIPIIVLAGDRHDKLKSLKMGANDFLDKPYDLEELELRITKLVHSSRLAQNAKRAKNEFLNIASHELRTPMHHITGLAGLLDGENLGDEQRQLIDQLKQEAGNLTDIIRDILNYVRLDQGAALASVEPFSLRATVQNVLEAHKKDADERRATLELSITDDVSDALNGPSFYVYKVFSILVENAIKFSSEGEIRVAIREESLGSHGSRFCCSVSDGGIGIHSDFFEKIFEPFIQVDSSNIRKFEGIGIGLAIAKRMVELMGGTISVKSDIGVGSEFNFSFHCGVQNSQKVQ